MSSLNTPPHRAARYPFAAKVVLNEPESNTCILGVTSDLSEGGCCVRVPEIFARGTKVHLEITKNAERLEISATVAYGLPPNVMGLCFGEMTAQQRTVLSGWIEQAIPTLRRMGSEKEHLLFDRDTIPAGAREKKS